MKPLVQMSATTRERIKYIDSCGVKLKRSKRVLAKKVCIRNMRRRLKRELQADTQENKRRAMTLETMEQGCDWEALRQYEEAQRAREKQLNSLEAPGDDSNLPGVDPNVCSPALLTRSSSFRDLDTRRGLIGNELVRQMQTDDHGRDCELMRQYKEEHRAMEEIIAEEKSDKCSADSLTLSIKDTTNRCSFIPNCAPDGPHASDLHAMRQFEEDQRAREKLLHIAEEPGDESENDWIIHSVQEEDFIAPAFLSRSFSFRDKNMY